MSLPLQKTFPYFVILSALTNGSPLVSLSVTVTSTTDSNALNLQSSSLLEVSSSQQTAVTDTSVTALPIGANKTLGDVKSKSYSSKKPSIAGATDSSLKVVEQEYEMLPTPQRQKSGVKGYTRSDGTYVIEDTSGMPCVMAYFKARLTVYYPVNKKQEKYKSTVVSPPDDVDISGSCDRDGLIAVLDLIWDQGVFSLRFAFDDLTDSWYVDRFTFQFNTKSSAYKGVEKEEKVLLKSEEKRRFWTTSHARSFRCLLLHDVSLIDENDSYSATIHFDEARVQALTKTETFKTPKHCIHRVHRDEMVPIFVGGTLAASTLITVTAYAAFRYFKVKKFQYGTMEE